LRLNKLNFTVSRSCCTRCVAISLGPDLHDDGDSLASFLFFRSFPLSLRSSMTINNSSVPGIMLTVYQCRCFDNDNRELKNHD
jgi:hypothetical protein